MHKWHRKIKIIWRQIIQKTWTSKATSLLFLPGFGLFFSSRLWLLEFLHGFSSSVFALMCYFLWFAAGGGSSCSPVLARKHKGDYFKKQIFNCIPFWFFVFFFPLPTSLSCWTSVFIHNCLCYQLSLITVNLKRTLISDIAINIF